MNKCEIDGGAALEEFQHNFPRLRVLCGKGSLNNLARELDRSGCTRAFIITGRTLSRHAEGVPRLQRLLGNRLVGVFSEVEAHSPASSVESAAKAIAIANADAVIALGGGSAVITARGAVIFHGEQKPLRDLHTRFTPGQPPVSPKLAAPKLPIFTVPTTPTTAAAKAGTALLGSGHKARLTMFDPKTRAQALFIDPALVMSSPASLVLDAGLHAFSTAVQGLESARREPLADAGLIHALRLLAADLPLVGTSGDNPSMRSRLVLSAILAGEASDHTGGGGLVSALVHSLGVRSGFGNGKLNALLLPHAIRFNMPETRDRISVIADVLGQPGQDVADACAAFFRRLGLPSRLREAEIDDSLLPEIVTDIRNDWFFHQNPKAISSDEEVMSLLSAAY